VIRSRVLAGFLSAGLLLAPAIGGDRSGSLLVSAAASLRDALSDVAQAFRSDEAVPTDLHTAASGALLRQILAGAPIDALVSASPEEIDRLVDAGLADRAAVRTIAGNRITVIVPSGEVPPSDLAGLADPRFDRIALGNPRTAPAGRYARDALRSAGVWDGLQDRLVFAENVRQVVEYVARGDAVAGLVYRTDAARFSDRVGAGPEAPPGSHQEVLYQAVPIRGGAHTEAASRFVEFVAGPRGRSVLASHGFLPPPAP